MLFPHQFIGGVSASPCSPPGWVRQCWAQGQRRVWPRGSTGFLRDHKSQVWSGWLQVRVNKCQSDLESMTDIYWYDCELQCGLLHLCLSKLSSREIVKNMICEIWVIWWYDVLWTNASSIDQFASHGSVVKCQPLGMLSAAIAMWLARRGKTSADCQLRAQKASKAGTAVLLAKVWLSIRGLPSVPSKNYSD